MNEKNSQFSFLPPIENKKNRRKPPSIDRLISHGPLSGNPIFYYTGGEIMTVERGPEDDAVQILYEDSETPGTLIPVVLSVSEYKSLVSLKTQKKLHRSTP